MTETLRYTAVALATAAGLLAIGAGPATAAVAPPETIVEQPFVAHSGDSCRYGITKGILGWRLGPFVGTRPVDVTGVLVDRPQSTDPAAPCGDDGRFSSVTLTAFSGALPVDREIRRVDNSSVDYRFQLVNETSTLPINRVRVQVCRHSLLPGPFDYCGPEQDYRAPVN